MFILATNLVGCLSLSSFGTGRPLRLRRCSHPQHSWRHPPRRQRSTESSDVSLYSDRRRDDNYNSRNRKRSASSPGWLPVLVAAACSCGHVDAAGALDATQFHTPHTDTVGVTASSSQHPLGDVSRSFVRKGTFHSDASPEGVTWTPLPTILVSAESAASNEEDQHVAKTIEAAVLETPKDAQQTIPTPITSECPGPSSEAPTQSTIPQEEASKQKPKEGALQATGIEKIAAENKIDVELICTEDQPGGVPTTSIQIDRETFRKIKVYQPPFVQYLPSSVQPWVARQFRSVQALDAIPDDQLFLASVCAGSLTEILRTGLLYPLSTVKVRVQARKSRSAAPRSPPWRQLRTALGTTVEEARRGNLYAGIVPSLLVAVPASGVYSGMKEVSRRGFSGALQFQALQNLLPGDDGAHSSALVVNLLAAFVADVAAQAVRTPGDVLALRLQVFGNDNVRSDFGNWAKDSILLLQPMILTDIPFLLIRIALNAAVTTGGETLGRYEFETIAIACLCAFLTTPFDVARTRILLPTLPSEEETAEGAAPPHAPPDEGNRRLVASSKYREERRQKLSVLRTMDSITKEGNGGVQNLYAGWFERTAFLGVGRAWLDPLRVIGYLGVRDALLLKLFN